MSLARDARYLADFARWLAEQGRLALGDGDQAADAAAWDYITDGISDLDGATAPPKPNTMAATPGEFAAVWNSLTGEQRQGFLNALRAADDTAVRCRDAAPEAAPARRDRRNAPRRRSRRLMVRLSDPQTTGLTRAWHGTYCRWYDADRAGRKRLAAVWGVVSDVLVRFL